MRLFQNRGEGSRSPTFKVLDGLGHLNMLHCPPSSCRGGAWNPPDADQDLCVPSPTSADYSVQGPLERPLPSTNTCFSTSATSCHTLPRGACCCGSETATHPESTTRFQKGPAVRGADFGVEVPKSDLFGTQGILGSPSSVPAKSFARRLRGVNTSFTDALTFSSSEAASSCAARRCE